MNRRIGLLLVSGSLVALVALAATWAGSVSDDESVRSTLPTLQQSPDTSSPTPLPTAAIEVPVASSSLTALAASAVIPPTRVQIPAAGIDMSIVDVGVKEDGEMEIPDDPSTAGWYRWGSAPGGGVGSTVVAAHVDSLRFGLGPFARLRSLPAGSEIVITGADGVDHRYTAATLSYYPKDELPAAELFDRSGVERLVLITCGGSFDETALTYSDNVIVTATPIS